MTSPAPGRTDAIARAYDLLAPGYEADLAGAWWVRERLWERFDAIFPAGARVLDVTAGTGLDAVHLARRGVRVVACDVSPGMLARLRERDPTIETHVLDAGRIGAMGWDASFDGVISTFAGLSTSPDLRPFAAAATQVLRAGGIVFLQMLNRWPLLDVARRLGRLRLIDASRTLLRPRRDVRLAGIAVPHFFHDPFRLYRRVFADRFVLVAIRAQGVVRPLDAHRGGSLEWAERALAARPPFRSLGTFFSMELRLR